MQETTKAAHHLQNCVGLQSDERWLAALRGGEPEAWRAFVQEYSGRVYRYFANGTPTSEDVEHLAGQAMQAICEQLPHFRAESSLLTWIYAICRNVLVDCLRRRGRFAFFLQNYTPLALVSALPDPEAALVQKDEATQLHEAIRGLPLKYKEVLILRHIEEHSIRETAKILDISPDLVKNRTRLGKEYLRKRLLQRGFRGAESLVPAQRKDGAS